MSEVFKTHGALSWTELLTTDPEAAKKFYGDLFGWHLQAMPMEGFDYTVVKTKESDETGFGGIMPLPKEAPAGTPPHWGSYITVDDVDATAKKVEELGGKVIMAPFDVPKVGRITTFMDPQGALLSAITYSSDGSDC